MTPPYGHILKCHSQYFRLIVTGHKLHEVRPADREYATGQRLRLAEYIPEADHYTGAEVTVVITGEVVDLRPLGYELVSFDIRVDSKTYTARINAAEGSVS